MATADIVSKCRECGAVRPAGYSSADHGTRDHCDGQLDRYCTVCRKFIYQATCPLCTARIREAHELAQRRRREAILRWRNMPVVAQVHSMLRLNPWFRKALDDWEQREGLRRGQKRDLLIVAVTLVGGMFLPQAWKPLVYVGIVAVGFVVASLKTIPDDAD
jgi:hypothetical protein